MCPDPENDFQLTTTRKNKTKKRKRKSPQRKPANSAAEQQVESPSPSTGFSLRMRLFAAGVLIVVFAWSYWPVINDLVVQWTRVADYSHGFLVVPLAIGFLWYSRDSFPGLSPRISWMGAALILLAGVMRIAGSYYFLAALQAWSIPVWIAGCTWLLFGSSVLKWAAPAIGFLVFMVPLPFTVENMLSLPLQAISTQVSLFIFQFMQQPAIAEGTTILLGDQPLEVARACSGLRIFFGIAALAYGFIIFFERPFWTKMSLVLAIIPIAILANSFRIVMTGLLYQFDLGDVAKQFSHDFAGIVMIPVAALLFAITLKYLDKLFPIYSQIDMESLIRRQATK